MMARRGLSYDQGPPLAAPLSLFLLAPPFLILAGLAGIVLAPDWLSGRWTPATLALVHLVTLGYLGAVMQGALLQMLPVVLGAPVPGAGFLARCGIIGLGAGTPLLAAGLLWREPAWLAAALAALALAWLPFLAGLARALLHATGLDALGWTLRLAGLALAVTVFGGLALAGGLAGAWPLAGLAALVDIHVGWALFGWVLALVVGVAYQVVPMLQVTPAYPRLLQRLLTVLLPVALLAYTIHVLAPRSGAWPLAALTGGGASLAFVAATLYLFGRRRRKLADATLDFWRLGLVALALASLAWLMGGWLPESLRGPAELSLGLLFLVGFAVSVVSGMLYKIVPFLCWFHLQTQTGARAGSIPNMHEMIGRETMRRHFRLHLAATILLAPAPFLPAWVAGLGLSALILGGQQQWLGLLAARRAFLDAGGGLEGVVRLEARSQRGSGHGA